MNAITQSLPGCNFAPMIADRLIYEDPLDADVSSDRTVTATRRGLTRLALIAAETGARFQREGEGHDPMGWLLAPRRLFGGGTAIDAVLARDDFMRALLLHGLSIGLDADPEFIDRLVREGPEDDGDHGDDDDDDGGQDDDIADGDEGADASDPDVGADDGWHDCSDDARAGRGREGSSGKGPQLFTATLVHEDGSMMLQAFHASICTDAIEATRRLTWRYGPGPASAAEVVAGFDPTTTFAEALVSPALCDLLALVAAEPTSPLAAGLDVNLEQRFAA